MIILFSFVYGRGTYDSLAAKYKVHYDTIRKIIRDFQSDLNNLAETYDLVSPNNYKFKSTGCVRVAHPELINESFLSLLSAPTAPILTEAEQTYAWIYTYTGDSGKALKQSKLDAGLENNKEVVSTPQGTTPFQNAVKIRGFYLRSKENVRDYIISLRERKLADLKVDKSYVQSHLIEIIENLRDEADPSTNRNNMLKSLELLGKTCNAFTENIRIEEVKPGDALDSLLELAKRDVVDGKKKVINAGAQDADGTSWVYEPIV